MKLCPLFESIEHQPQLELHVAPEVQQRHFFRGVAAANAKVSSQREAIEAAIALLIANGEKLSKVKYEALPGTPYRRWFEQDILENQQHIEQLQALLPKE